MDPATLVGLGEPLRITWPTGMPTHLVDAHGTLALLGSLEENLPVRTSLVPIDVSAGAACRPNTFLVASRPDAGQSFRGFHFEGDTLGAVVETRDRSATTALFTRFTCRAE